MHKLQDSIKCFEALRALVLKDNITSDSQEIILKYIFLMQEDPICKALREYIVLSCLDGFYWGTLDDCIDRIYNEVKNDNYTFERLERYIAFIKIPFITFPIALTLAGMGSVGILAVGVSLGIITSPVLIMAGFAIAGLIPVVWLMHWLINVHPAEAAVAQVKPPTTSCFQTLAQKLGFNFFSKEKNVPTQQRANVNQAGA